MKICLDRKPISDLFFEKTQPMLYYDMRHEMAGKAKRSKIGPWNSDSSHAQISMGLAFRVVRPYDKLISEITK